MNSGTIGSTKPSFLIMKALTDPVIDMSTGTPARLIFSGQEWAASGFQRQLDLGNASAIRQPGTRAGC
jgi:hypothetical protein